MIGCAEVVSVSASCSRCYNLISSSMFPYALWLICFMDYSLFHHVFSVYMSQTLFSLYLHNQWTDFHKLSCTGMPQMRAIRTYMGCTKVTTNNWDIRTSVAVKALSANISWIAEQICMIKLALESAQHFVSNNIWCVSKQ